MWKHLPTGGRNVCGAAVPAVTRRTHPTAGPGVYHLLSLQAAAGNQAVTGYLSAVKGGLVVARDATEFSPEQDDSGDRAAEVEAVAEAIEASIDGGVVADMLRADAGGGGGDGGETSVQTFTVQREDPTPAPKPPVPGDVSDILDAIFALSLVKQLMDRLGELVAKTLRKDGYGGAITFGALALPGVASLAHQGVGIHKFSLKTPEIKLDSTHKMTFKLDVDTSDPSKRLSIPSATLKWSLTFP